MFKSEVYASCKINGNPLSIEWNENGGLIVEIDPEKKIKLFDPNSNTIVFTTVVIDR